VMAIAAVVEVRRQTTRYLITNARVQVSSLIYSSTRNCSAGSGGKAGKKTTDYTDLPVRTRRQVGTDNM